MNFIIIRIVLVALIICSSVYLLYKLKSIQINFNKTRKSFEDKIKTTANDLKDDRTLKGKVILSVNNRLDKILYASGLKYSTNQFVGFSIIVFLISLIALKILLKMFIFAFLLSFIISFTPLLFLLNKQNKVYKSVSAQTHKLIVGCVEASMTYSTAREIVLVGSVGTVHEATIAKYGSFYDIRIHESIRDIAMRTDDRMMLLFANVLKQAELSGSSLSDVLENFYNLITLQEDSSFIKSLNIIRAISQFQIGFFFYCSNIFIYLFFMRDVMQVFYQPYGMWLLIGSLILIITNVFLLLWEILSQ